MIRNAPVAIGVSRLKVGSSSADRAVDLLDGIIKHLDGGTVASCAVTEQSSKIEMQTAMGKVAWCDLRGLDGRAAPLSSLPTLRLWTRSVIQLSVRLPSSTPRSLVGAEDPEDMIGLATMLRDLCWSVSAPVREPCHEARIACGAYLMARDEPLREGSWLGLGLRMPSPWSPTTLLRVSPTSEDEIGDEPFPKWNDFCSKVPLDLEITTTRQDETTTMSMACGSLPVLRPVNELEAMRLISSWEARPTAPR